MAQVYVVQEPGQHNILPAEKFGQIRILLRKSDVVRGFAHCYKILQVKLAAYRNVDYLLPIGDPLLMCAATAILAQNRKHGKIQLLRWSREDYCYNPETIHL